MDWEEIQKAITGNAAYEIIKTILIVAIPSILSIFGVKRFKKIREEKEIQKAEKINNILLTPYPKPLENEVKGRDINQQEINSLLNTNKDVLLLSGMGGIGKTTLAAYYIQQNITDYDTIAWINTSQGFYEAFAFNDTLIKNLGIEEKLKTIQTTTDPKDYPKAAYDEIIYQLNQRNGKLLLVIDNAIDGQPVQTLRDGLKREWKLLVTAREPLGGFTQYLVGILSEAAAIELFNEHYTREKNKKLVKEILQRVAYHTLSIELIAKTAQQKNGYTLKQLKTDLENKGLTVAKGIAVKTKYRQQFENEAYSIHIMECLQTAFDVAQLGDNEDYIYTLKNLCLLPSIAMAFDFIADLLAINEEEDRNHFNTTLNNLASKGWLEKKDENYKLHPVIHEILQIQLSPQPKEVENLISGLIRIIEIDETTHIIKRMPTVPYIDSVLAYFTNDRNFTQENYTDSWGNIVTLLNNYSKVKEAKGDLDSALKNLNYSSKIIEMIFFEDHFIIATLYNNLSEVYRKKGDKIALSFQLKAIDELHKTSNKNYSYLATSYNNLSLIFQADNDLDMALKYQLQATEIRERVLNEHHPDLATSYNNLAEIYRTKNRLNIALKYQLKAVEIRERVLGNHHPDLATSYNNLALIYFDSRKSVDALKYQLKAIDIFENLLDENHPYLSVTYLNLVVIYYDLGKKREQQNIYKKVKQ